MMNLDDRQATRLHYEVMGIALAVLGHQGESEFYEEINTALTEPNWMRLAMIHRAFEILPEPRKRQILSDEEGDKDAVAWTLEKFKANYRMMHASGSQKTA